MNTDCPICLEDVNESHVVLPCRHKMDLKCFIPFMNNCFNNNKCPICRSEFAIGRENNNTVELLIRIQDTNRRYDRLIQENNTLDSANRILNHAVVFEFALIIIFLFLFLFVR